MKYLLGSALIVASSLSFAGAPAPVVDTEAGKVQDTVPKRASSFIKGSPMRPTPLPRNDGFRTLSPCSPGRV